jgi:hypothetical protein
MKKCLLVLALMLTAGCGQPIVSEHLMVSETSTYSSVQSGAGYPATFEVLTGSSASMVLVKWACEVTNQYTTPTKGLIVDCLDDEGEVRATWDLPMVVQPGESAKVHGAFDVPATEARVVTTVLVRLVTAGERSQPRLAP